MKRAANILTILILALGYVVACSGPVKESRMQTIIDQSKKPNDTPTPAIIADVIIEGQGVNKALNDPKDGAKVTVEGMGQNDPDFEKKKGHAVAKIDEATSHNKSAMTKATTAHESATTDVKEKGTLAKQVQKYKAADPVLAWLNLIAIVCIALGAGGLIASFFLPSLFPALTVAPHVRAGGLALLVYGFFMAALAEFLDETRLIFWLLGLGALAIGLVWAVKWALRNRQLFLNTVDHLDAGVKAGQIIITPAAKDPDLSVSKAFADDATTAAIEARQRQLRKKASHHRRPNLDPAANGPASVSQKPTAPAAPAATV